MARRMIGAGNKQEPAGNLLDRVAVANRTNPTEALRMVRQALTEVVPGRDFDGRLLRARLIRYRGHARRALNDFPGALADYRLALRTFTALGDWHEAAVTRIGQVSALFYRGRHEEALEAAEAGRIILMRLGDRLRLARLDTNTGNIFHRLDRPADALVWYERARRAFRRVGDAGDLALVDLNSGNVLIQLGRLDEARAAYHAARTEFIQRGLDLAVAEADYGLAYLLFVENRFTEALEAFENLRPRLERLGERRLAALCDMDSAETYLRLNLWEEALIRAERAGRLFRALEMRYEEARSGAFLGMAHFQLGRRTPALTAWRRAATLFEREGNRTWRGLLLLFMARAERHLGRRAEARSLVLRAQPLLRPPAPMVAAAEATFLLGVINAELARTPRARSLARVPLASASRTARKLGADWLHRDAEEALGELARVDGRRPAARRHLGNAVEAGERLRSMIGGDEFQAAFFRDRSHPYLTLARLELESGRLDEAYAWIERGRARSLLSDVGRLPRRTASEANRARDRAAELEAVLRRLASHYQPGQALHAGQRPVAGASRLPDQLRRHLESRAEALMDRIYPVARALSSRIDPAGANRPLLSADEALISYFENDGVLSAFVETADGLSLATDLASVGAVAGVAERLRWQWERFRLGGSHFERHGRLLLDDAVEDLRLLHSMLVAPLAMATTKSRWIVVPGPSMAGLPIAAFHDGRQFLVESRETVVTPGRAVLAMCRARLSRRGSGTLLIGQSGPGTPEVAAELRAIQRITPKPVQILKGKDATVANVRRLAGACRVLHLASHGFFHGERPRLSGIRLADRWLHANDIAGESLTAELVVLSACQSGTSMVFGGDEWMGLSRAFLKSGAARVLASLWDVDDRATRRLMTRFTAEWARPGVLPAAALAKAQRALLLENRHPYFWAGFELLGTP
ncbi:MAG: CHAT domain-containing protein [Candidatus Eisenbacteria bacterium]|nr:CHAT domain-containing protein [Candidatus Eisenbacteria bacterium]